MERLPIVKRYLDLTKPGLELGPSHYPTVRKSDGYPVEVVDHATADDLRAKYTGRMVQDLDAIEDVDFVWQGGSLVDLTGKPGGYQWIIAAHFIEHTVDVIAFLKDCSDLLVDGGKLFLIVPDKRLIFDRFRPVSTLGQLIDQELWGLRFHSPGGMVDADLYHCFIDGDITWSPGRTGNITSRDDSKSVQELATRALAQEEYQDAHRWCFTPESLSLMVEDLADMGRHSLKIEAVEVNDTFEFVMVLQKSAEPFVRTRGRIEAMLAIEEEQFAFTPAGIELAAIRSELVELTSSRSWRITAPLRSVASGIRRMLGRG